MEKYKSARPIVLNYDNDLEPFPYAVSILKTLVAPINKNDTFLEALLLHHTYIEYQENKDDGTLTIRIYKGTSDNNITNGWYGPIPLENAIKCPILILEHDYINFCPPVSPQKISLYNKNPSRPFVTIAACCILIYNNKILLTRRAKHMRTFPSAWVMPGGGLEKNECLKDTAARELHEETGIKLSQEKIENELDVLCFYESIYPTTGEICFKEGKISAHYLIAYYMIDITSKDDKNEDLIIKLDNESDAYTWLPMDYIVNYISMNRENDEKRFFKKNNDNNNNNNDVINNPKIKIYIDDGSNNNNNNMKTDYVQLSKIGHQYENDQMYGIGEGHLYALKELGKRYRNDSFNEVDSKI